jgi:hypothetical protein
MIESSEFTTTPLSYLVIFSAWLDDRVPLPGDSGTAEPLLSHLSRRIRPRFLLLIRPWRPPNERNRLLLTSRPAVGVPLREVLLVGGHPRVADGGACS